MLNYLVIAALALIFPVMVIGSTLLEESERYVLILGDDDAHLNNLYLEFYEIDSKKNRQIIVDEGYFSFGEQEYSIITEWKGSFLNDDKLFFTAGNIENFDEKIDVFLMGKFLKKTIDGSLYDITVHIHSEPHVEFQTTAEIIGITPKEISEDVQIEDPIELLFLIKDTHHRFQDQDYAFTTKLYDKKQNPTGEWDTKGGAIDNAEIIVKAMDLEGNILREIKGNTNEFGWFKGKFPTGVVDFPRGEYLVLYTAKYQNNIAGEQKPLYVFETKTDANYRHFTPTYDIDRGQWSDQEGNNDHLMFNELDEYIRDDSDYVSSKALGKKKDSTDDTFHVGITTYAGVTTDHEHVISYVLRKEAAGGYEINFTVTLFDGPRQIAQWTHLNVDENFKLFTNILTLDEKKSISNYGNLSLEFTAESLSCDSCQKREAQVSWIHMIV